MSSISIDYDFVRSLTKGIRNAYGKEVKHTDILGIVAAALGWKADALMHALKNSADDSFQQSPRAYMESSQADNRARLMLIRNAGLELLRADGLDDALKLEVLAGTGAACLALKRYKEAYDLMTGSQAHASQAMEGLLPRDWRDLNGAHGTRMLLVALSELALDVNPDKARWTLLSAIKGSPELMGSINAFVRPDPDTNYRTSAHWKKAFRQALGMMSDWKLIKKIQVIAAEVGANTLPVEPAVPVEESVNPDGIVCLFDGAERKMLHRYLLTRFKITPDGYRDYFDLDPDYPMVAPGYTAEKQRIAIAIPGEDLLLAGTPHDHETRLDPRVAEPD